jgi:prepilin-type processing-associated H-X9-DG protein
MQTVQDLQCQSNLKQIAASVLNYSADAKGALPPTRYVKSGLYWCDLLVRGGYLSAPDSSQRSDTDPPASNSVLWCPKASELLVTWTADSGASDPVITLPRVLTPGSSDPDAAQGFARLGPAGFMVDCTYYWNGCSVKLAQTDLDNAADTRNRFPSLTVDDTDLTNPTFHLLASHMLRDISQIKLRTTQIMVTDGVLFYDGTTSKPRIAARHPGGVQDHTGDPDAQYYNTHTNMAFYDGHVQGVDRDQGKDDLYANDFIMKATGLEMTTANASTLFLLPRH